MIKLKVSRATAVKEKNKERQTERKTTWWRRRFESRKGQNDKGGVEWCNVRRV